jgi:hypothetical protein
MEPATDAAPPPPHTPDWSSISEDLRCPLCDYALRGLSEPRCPECGYRFEWPDLTDPARRRHPYLFEHHPRRNLWSFARTLLGGLRPGRFWSSLQPSQPSRPGRLLLYWVLATLLLPVGYGAMIVKTGAADAREAFARRNDAVARAARYLTFHGKDPAGAAEFEDSHAGSDGHSPHPVSLAYLRQVYRYEYAWTFPTHLRIALLYAAWPWLTLGTLLIFRASMRRAKVRGVHALRCALYCCDGALWLGTAAVISVPWLMQRLDLGRYIGYRHLALAALLYAAVTAWRLAAACRHYLRFDHPRATALASQVIVLLGVLVYLYLSHPEFDF